MPRYVMAVGFIALVSSHAAAAPALNHDLAGLSFLVGDWASGNGKVADTGGTSTGASTITPEAGGAVLLRRDHTNLFNASGASTGRFDQIMMIYAEGGQIHADYADGTHILHYISADITPGRSVVFTTAPHQGAPVFQLAYTRTTPTTLALSFSMTPPGAATPHPIATGTLQKVH